MSFCPNCGQEIGEDMKFCPQCGHQLMVGQEVKEKGTCNVNSRYNAAIQLHNQEFRAIGERTAAFLIVQSILVAGLGHVIISESVILPYAFTVIVSGIIVIGVLYCLMHCKAGELGSLAAFRWRRYMRHVERNEEQEEPWEWFYKQCERPKLADWEKPSPGKKTTEARLLYEPPWPSSWLLSPAIFSSVWFGAACYIIIRLYCADDNLRQSLDALLLDDKLGCLVNPIMIFAAAAAVFALVVFVYMVVKVIKWCRRSLCRW